MNRQEETMAFGMTSTSIPGVRIRPPSSAPGVKAATKKRKRKLPTRKPTRRPSKSRAR